MLMYLFFESARDLSDPSASYTGSEVLGMGVPLFVAVMLMAIGLVLMLVWRFSNQGREFFGRSGFEAVPPEIASGQVTLAPDTAGAGQ